MASSCGSPCAVGPRGASARDLFPPRQRLPDPLDEQRRHLGLGNPPFRRASGDGRQTASSLAVFRRAKLTP